LSGNAVRRNGHCGTVRVHDMNTRTPPETDAARLSVLRLLQQNPEMSQRALSQALGLSLGKTHYLLHALLDKGWIKARNLKRSDRKISYAYLLTPSGLRHKLQLTQAFLHRKEAEFDTLKLTIAQLRSELTARAAETPDRGRPLD